MRLVVHDADWKPKPTQVLPPEWITPEEAVSRTGLSMSQIRNMAFQGVIRRRDVWTKEGNTQVETLYVCIDGKFP